MPNAEEFVRVIKENEGIIFKISSFYTDDAEDQKDLYQEIVYQLWKSFDSFRNESKFSTWMYRIALNTSITHLSRQKRKAPQVSIDKVVLNKMDHHDQEMQERLAELYAQIKFLGAPEKAIVLLHLEGHTYEEIADITGFTPTNVGTRLHRIKEKLKSRINQ